MQTLVEAIFDEFADTLNAELSCIGCFLRVAGRMQRENMITLLDEEGVTLGHVPDYVDAETISAIEKLLMR